MGVRSADWYLGSGANRPAKQTPLSRGPIRFRERLREYQDLSWEEYVAPDEQDRRDAIERKFEKPAEATLNIASELCKQERGDVPGRRKARIVDADLAGRMRTAVSFRDVLAHTYGPIVNDDIVFDALRNDLDRYVEFVEAVDAYLNPDDE